MQLQSRLSQQTQYFVSCPGAVGRFSRLSGVSSARRHRVAGSLCTFAGPFRASDKTEKALDVEVVGRDKVLQFEGRSGADLVSSAPSTSYGENEESKPFWSQVWRSVVKTAAVGALCLAMVRSLLTPAVRDFVDWFHTMLLGADAINILKLVHKFLKCENVARHGIEQPL